MFSDYMDEVVCTTQNLGVRGFSICRDEVWTNAGWGREEGIDLVVFIGLGC